MTFVCITWSQAGGASIHRKAIREIENMNVILSRRVGQWRAEAIDSARGQGIAALQDSRPKAPASTVDTSCGFDLTNRANSQTNQYGTTYEYYWIRKECA